MSAGLEASTVDLGRASRDAFTGDRQVKKLRAIYAVGWVQVWRPELLMWLVIKSMSGSDGRIIGVDELEDHRVFENYLFVVRGTLCGERNTVRVA